MIDFVDNLLLRQFVRFAHWFQKLTGVTCYAIARACLAVYALTVAVDVADYYVPDLDPSTSTHSLWVLAGSGMVVWSFAASVYLSRHERRQNSNVAFRPDFVLLTERWFRLMYAFLVPLTPLLLLVDILTGAPLASYVNDITPVPLVAACYLSMSLPLPRGKSKIRQLVESFSASLRPAVADSA